MHGRVHLVGGKDVDRKRRVAEVAARLGLASHRDLAQPWFQGNGRECGDRGSVWLTVGIGTGDDGDAARELTEDSSKLILFHDRTSLRSEERRVGKECVRTCRSRWSR